MWTGTAAKPVELGQVEADDEGLVARDVIRRCGRTVALGICPKNANTGRGSELRRSHVTSGHGLVTMPESLVDNGF